MDGDRPETSRDGDVWSAADWSPVELNGSAPGPAAFDSADQAITPRARLALRRRGCRSLAWAPMCSSGRVVGAVELSDAAHLDLAPHLSVIAGFADLCAHGLGLEDTYEELAHRERAMQELIDLSHEIAATHDIEGFVRDLAHRLMAAVNADDVDIWRVKDGRVTLLVSLDRDGVDASLIGVVMDLDKYPGTAGALERLEPFVVDNIDDARLTDVEIDAYHRWGFVSSLTMPLVAGGRLVGLVDVYDDAERDWTVHIPFLTGVLQPVAGLFDNALLLHEVEQHSRFQQDLVDLSLSLSRAGSLRDVAEEAARRLRDMTGCDGLRHLVAGGRLPALPRQRGRGRRRREPSGARRSSSQLFPSTAEAARAPRTPRVRHARRSPRDGRSSARTCSFYGYSSAFSVPLVSGDETLGMIDIFDTRERDYADVRELLLSAGGSVAGALKSAFLMENLRQSNTALRELVELSDELNEAAGLPELARTVAGRLRDILQAEDCDIWRIDDGRMLCLASIDSRGWDEEEVGSERDLATYSDSVAALIANEPIVIGDLEATELPEDERAAYRRWGYRSMVSLPLVAEGALVGPDRRVRHPRA